MILTRSSRQCEDHHEITTAKRPSFCKEAIHPSSFSCDLPVQFRLFQKVVVCISCEYRNLHSINYNPLRNRCVFALCGEQTRESGTIFTAEDLPGVDGI
jgi:hypothetical protein